MKKNPFVGLAGNIGVGKTTFTEIIAEKFGWIPYYESVADNPYLIDFYRDMSRWSFNLQVYFLHKRFKTHHEMSMSNGGAIQDRTIYEDVEIFARPRLSRRVQQCARYAPIAESHCERREWGFSPAPTITRLQG